MAVRLRSTDLFPTDKELDPDRLIGRAEDVSDLSRQLTNGINLVVAGPRRTGKTSVCKAVLAGLRSSSFYVVQADLFRLASASDLAERLVVSTVANRSGLHRVAHRSRSLGRSALRATQLAVKTRAMQELGDELEIAFTPGAAGRDPARYLRYSMELLQRIAEKDDKQLVLFIDEFQELAGRHERFGDVDTVTQMMVSVLKASPRVTCLFAGSVEHLLRDLFSEERRAFYRLGEVTTLSQISEPEWHSGLTERFAEDDCTLSADAFARLIERGERHPRATMLIAQRAHDASVAEDTHDIDASLVEVGWQLARRVDATLNAETVERIKGLSAGAFEAAQAIAAGRSPYQVLHSQQARRAIDALVRAGIVDEPQSGSWRIDDPTLRAYLSSMGVED